MTEYTPDTEEVRELYWAVSGDPRRGSKAWAEFDRWLQKVKAEAWAEGQQSGAKWGVQDWTDEYPPADNPYES